MAESNLNKFVINYLTEEQYQEALAAGTLNDNDFYCTADTSDNINEMDAATKEYVDAQIAELRAYVDAQIGNINAILATLTTI